MQKAKKDEEKKEKKKAEPYLSVLDDPTKDTKNDNIGSTGSLQVGLVGKKEKAKVGWKDRSTYCHSKYI